MLLRPFLGPGTTKGAYSAPGTTVWINGWPLFSLEQGQTPLEKFVYSCC